MSADARNWKYRAFYLVYELIQAALLLKANVDRYCFEKAIVISLPACNKCILGSSYELFC